ncbi:hypothetical protein NERG_01755 [Nematocida ausubeli]|uniref:t-SNARE coiled-coil homology domain-containing protein n=1 Tax=Nematocida ausubeli (strain ATCC PRA-371 / ERTm2) TaxID=1913371 RepID=H8ZDT4_NEMA1|nr:hypothetical protein NERG_01755 [Nematocida ausubeli]
MDRTREFRSLVAATNALQERPRCSEQPSAATVQSAQKNIDLLESAVSQRRVPSSALISDTERQLDILFDQIAGMQCTEDIDQSIVRLMKHKHSGFILKLREILSRHRENEQRKAAALHQEEQQRRTPSTGHAMQQETRHVSREIQREEMSSIRRREFESLEQHINELGQMVTEVSMHISLQGEKVDLIDGLFTQAKSNLRGGSYELRGALEKVKQKRRSILVIFAVLFGILFLKYLRWI